MKVGQTSRETTSSHIEATINGGQVPTSINTLVQDLLCTFISSHVPPIHINISQKVQRKNKAHRPLIGEASTKTLGNKIQKLTSNFTVDDMYHLRPELALLQNAYLISSHMELVPIL